MRNLLRLIVPEAMLVSYKEHLRAATGALLGILITGYIGHLTVGNTLSCLR